jgi:protein SCO1
MTRLRAGWQVCALLIAGISCGDGRAPVGPVPHVDAETPGPSTSLPGASLYELDADWQDQRGSHVKLDLWRGNVVAVVLFFGTCESACSALVHDLTRIESELPEPARARLRALLVTIDPERDGIEQLADYARHESLPEERWRLLRGDEPAVRELAAALGFRYRRLPTGQFSHSMQIVFLDPEGVVVHRIERLGQSAEDVARVLAKVDVSATTFRSRKGGSTWP